jgi:hypothetical protein
MHEVRRKKFGINDIRHKPGLKGAIGTFWPDKSQRIG